MKAAAADKTSRMCNTMMNERAEIEVCSEGRGSYRLESLLLTRRLELCPVSCWREEGARRGEEI